MVCVHALAKSCVGSITQFFLFWMQFGFSIMSFCAKKKKKKKIPQIMSIFFCKLLCYFPDDNWKKLILAKVQEPMSMIYKQGD